VVNGKLTTEAILFLTILFLLTSCAPYTQFTIQVLEPAAVTLPPTVRSIAFINRSDSLTEETLRRNRSQVSPYELFVLDSAINNKFFEGLMTGIRESDRFTEVNADIFSNRRSVKTGVKKILDSTQLRNVKSIVPADILISLEDYSARDSFDIYYDSWEENWAVNLVILSNTKWLIYDLQTNSVLDSYIQHDTLSWHENQYALNDEITVLPRLLEAFREAAFTTGYKYSRRIIPAWFDVERYLYGSGPMGMKRAANMAISGDWDNASAIWEELVRSGKKRAMAKAAFNIAVRNESEDKLEEAVRWAQKSFDLYHSGPAMDYINLLLLRELKKERLTKQIRINQVEE